MMRRFSSWPHAVLIAGGDYGSVKPDTRARATVTLIGSILLCAALLTGIAAFLASPRFTILGQEPTAAPSRSLSPSPSPSRTALPAEDVPGEDIASLPRYPESVRSDHEVALDERYRLVVTEYLADANLEEVQAFYRGVIAAHGWERADIGYSGGEWSYALVEGDTLALIEIEEQRGLIEIDLQISEALEIPSPILEPASTAAPLPPPPAPPLPPGDDDDDDDDGGGDD